MSSKEYLATPARSVAAQQNEIPMARLDARVADQRVRMSSRKLSPMFAVFAVCFASTANPLLADGPDAAGDMAADAGPQVPGNAIISASGRPDCGDSAQVR